MTAKTGAQRQRDYKARQREAGLTELRGVFLRVEDHAAARVAAAKVARKRAKVKPEGAAG